MMIGGVVIVYLLWAQFATGLRLVEPAEASPASKLVLTDESGRVVDLSAFEGQVVVVNLWAGWCGPCRREIPAINDVHDALGDRGLVILGVNLDDPSAGTLTDLKARHRIRYPVYAPAARLVGSFAVSDVIPQTWVIDRKGRVRAAHRGVVSRRSLMRVGRQLLDEPR